MRRERFVFGSLNRSSYYGSAWRCGLSGARVTPARLATCPFRGQHRTSVAREARPCGTPEPIAERSPRRYRCGRRIRKVSLAEPARGSATASLHVRTAEDPNKLARVYHEEPELLSTVQGGCLVYSGGSLTKPGVTKHPPRPSLRFAVNHDALRLFYECYRFPRPLQGRTIERAPAMAESISFPRMLLLARCQPRQRSFVVAHLFS